MELIEIRCVRGERHPPRPALVEDNLVEREDRWMDRPCASLQEVGWRDGPQNHSAGKGFGAQFRLGAVTPVTPLLFKRLQFLLVV